MVVWKTVNIFISSTFKDLQLERDFITRYLVPDLNDKLSPYAIRVNVIDLRSGIDTSKYSEEEKESRILQVCIDEIHNSRPYFIGILGGRYGWIPGESLMRKAQEHLNEDELERLKDTMLGKSVTELEMLIGLLHSQDLLSHSFFCIKKPESFQPIPPELKNIYIEENYQKELAELKRAVVSAFESADLSSHIIEYKGIWGKDGFEDLQGFVEKLSEKLAENIIKENVKEARPVSDFELDQHRIESFCASNIIDFSGREKLIRELTDFMIIPRHPVEIYLSNHGFCLTGFSGCGKSSIFSKIYSELKKLSEKDDKLIILPHVAGISERSVYFFNMLEDWAQILWHKIGIEKDSLDFIYEKTIGTLLRRALLRGFRPVILIDSLDSFQKSLLPKNFNFIPLEVPVLITSLPDTAKTIFHDNTRIKILNVDNFSEEDSKKMIHRVLKRSHKDLPEAYELSELRGNNGERAAESPLWLKIALQRILETDEKDYKIYFDSNKGLNLEKLISTFPASAEKMFQLLLEKSFDYYDKEIVLPSLILIALSKYGLTESDLEKLFEENWNPVEFSHAKLYFRPFLNISTIDKKISFSHNILINGILDYDAGLTKFYQLDFIDFLNWFINNDYHKGDQSYLKEIAYQVVNAKDYPTFKEIVIRFDLGNILQNSYRGFRTESLNFIKRLIDDDIILAAKCLYGFLKLDDNDEQSMNDAAELCGLYKKQLFKVLESEEPYPLPEKSFINILAPLSFLPLYSSTNSIDFLKEELERLDNIYNLVLKKWGIKGFSILCYYYFNTWCDIFIDLVVKMAHSASTTEQCIKDAIFFRDKLINFFKTIKEIADQLILDYKNQYPGLFALDRLKLVNNYMNDEDIRIIKENLYKQLEEMSEYDKDNISYERFFKEFKDQVTDLYEKY